MPTRKIKKKKDTTLTTLPFAFRQYLRCETIEKLMKDFDFLDIKKLNLVMDKGFYSEYISEEIGNFFPHATLFKNAKKAPTDF